MKLRLATRCLLALLPSCLVIVFVPVAHAEVGLQSELSAISGQGAGHVDVSPTADDQHDTVFIAQGTAEIEGALPDATYVVQRAVDFTPNDGVCTIAPLPPAGWITLTAFRTSESGAGAGHFVRKSTPPPVSQFDVIFRVVKQNDDTTLDLSQVLMSDCLTVTVK